MAWFPVDPMSVTAGWLSEVLDADVRQLAGSSRSVIGVGLLGRIYRAHLEGPDAPDVGGGEVSDPRRAGPHRSLRAVGVLPARSALLPGDRAGEPAPARPAVLRRLRRAHPRLRPRARGSGAAPGGRSDRRVHAEDAEIVIDAVARHHAHWWDSDRLASLSWLRSYRTPPFPSRSRRKLRGRLAPLPGPGRSRPVARVAGVRRAIPVPGAVVPGSAHAATAHLSAR